MAYTTTELITRAYYLSGILARGLQTVSGEQINDGLRLLNSFIAVKTANTRLIPYYSQYDFTLSANVEEYSIPNLIQVETFVFYIGDVRYSTTQVPRRAYFGSGRIQNIASLPFSWHLERKLNGANIYLYFLPESDYEATIWGKFRLANVALGQNLELTLDEYYIEYLRYGLAGQICEDNNISMPPQTYNRLQELEGIIQDISPPDLTMSKLSTLAGEGGLNWGDVNLGKGWRPGN